MYNNPKGIDNYQESINSQIIMNIPTCLVINTLNINKRGYNLGHLRCWVIIHMLITAQRLWITAQAFSTSLVNY